VFKSRVSLALHGLWLLVPSSYPSAFAGHYTYSCLERAQSCWLGDGISGVGWIKNTDYLAWIENELGHER
jgi:hypothetical protein